MKKFILTGLVCFCIGTALGYFFHTYKGKTAKHWFDTSVIIMEEVRRADNFRACVKKAFNSDDYNDIMFCIEDDKK